MMTLDATAALSAEHGLAVRPRKLRAAAYVFHPEASPQKSNEAFMSDIGEGFADGDSGCAGRRCFGGQYGAEDDECDPDSDGEHGDPEGQRC